jgi:hypothetical protein
MRPIRISWPPRKGVETDRAVTFGTGSQYVYCYSYSSHIELALVKHERRFRIKVGMANNDPIARIHDQISASKTAISEAAIVLLVFRARDCRHLEGWLHRQLDRAAAAGGREWFMTHPTELVGLFRMYLQRHSILPQFGSPPAANVIHSNPSAADDAIELTERDYL